MFAKIENNACIAYNLTVDDIKSQNNVSLPVTWFGGQIGDAEYIILKEIELPSYNTYTENIIEKSPVKIDNVWTRQWEIVPALPEQITERRKNAIHLALGKREYELKNSDWTQLPDSPLTAERKFEYAVYRQALRDITAQPEYPINIEWPVLPNTTNENIEVSRV